MENTALSRQQHDERLGDVAVAMGILTKRQVEDVVTTVMMSRVSPATTMTFSQAAVDMGILDAGTMARIEAEELRRRRMIHGYEILGVIGKGTIATVYLALQLAMDRRVALKILHPGLASDPVFVRAYLDEAQAVSRFHHPNIVQGIDAGESNGYYYFAHEFLSGGSLKDRLPRIESGEERFSENRLLQYLRQTAAALKHAWAVAVYHGDINPGNLLLDGQGNIKLANLGVPRVAQMKDGDSQSDTRPRLGFIRCGPEYAAPEQLGSPQTVNAATDMYSLGATFYHLSFGVPPFPRMDRADLLEYRRRNPVPSFSLANQEGFSSKYLRLIHEMLEIDPTRRRPSDPEELADRLEKFHIPDADSWSGLARQVRQISAPSRRGRKSDRQAPRAPAPSTRGAGRVYSLAPRTERLRPGRGLAWAAAAVVLIVVVVVLRLILSNY